MSSVEINNQPVKLIGEVTKHAKEAVASHCYDNWTEDSFVQDEPYCLRIETALAKFSDDTAGLPSIMRHARKALLYAVEQAVPNAESHQARLS